MKCPTCGEPLKAHGPATTSDDLDVRTMRCRHGHSALVFSVFPAFLATTREITARAHTLHERRARWARDTAIASDPRAVDAVAAEHKITPTRVRQIRAAMRSRLSARRGG